MLVLKFTRENSYSKHNCTVCASLMKLDVYSAIYLCFRLTL